jgi:hypothetical protein
MRVDQIPARRRRGEKRHTPRGQRQKRIFELSAMLPFDSSYPSSSGMRSGDTRFPDYARRLCDFRQMDFDSTFDQMLTLLSADPASAYTPFFYRKQTKNQWARDDPAFAVLEAGFVAVAALAFAVAFEAPNVWGYLWATVYCVLIDWLLIGIIVSSLCCKIANKFLRQHYTHSVEQEVEWLFAFDVHCNAFFCSFLITYVLQYMLLPLILHRSVVSCLISNILYSIAGLWYSYITYLGYKTLPFLGNPQVFLWYPVMGIVAMLILSIVLSAVGLHVNPSRILMAIHYS